MRVLLATSALLLASPAARAGSHDTIASFIEKHLLKKPVTVSSETTDTVAGTHTTFRTSTTMSNLSRGSAGFSVNVVSETKERVCDLEGTIVTDRCHDHDRTVATQCHASARRSSGVVGGACVVLFSTHPDSQSPAGSFGSVTTYTLDGTTLRIRSDRFLHDDCFAAGGALVPCRLSYDDRYAVTEAGVAHSRIVTRVDLDPDTLEPVPEEETGSRR